MGRNTTTDFRRIAWGGSKSKKRVLKANQEMRKKLANQNNQLRTWVIENPHLVFALGKRSILTQNVPKNKLTRDVLRALRKRQMQMRS